MNNLMKLLKTLFVKDVGTPLGWKKLDPDTFEYRYSVGVKKPAGLGWEPVYVTSEAEAIDA